ncbi:hypothetical protein DCAR_0521691 [Daucus carota subsp. sativus]|nr:hypothetical protein DCAR_0521691 [Daucus carota subsp. sativus]
MELDYLLFARRELWEMETMVDHIKCDHGYTAESPPIINVWYFELPHSYLGAKRVGYNIYFVLRFFT